MALGVGAGAVLLAPVLAPYWIVSQNLGLVRTLANASQYSATWRDYLATGGRLHYALWSAPFFPGSEALFPGVTVVALALVALRERSMPSIVCRG